MNLTRLLQCQFNLLTLIDENNELWTLKDFWFKAILLEFTANSWFYLFDRYILSQIGVNKLRPFRKVNKFNQHWILFLIKYSHSNAIIIIVYIFCCFCNNLIKQHIKLKQQQKSNNFFIFKEILNYYIFFYQASSKY